ncbi:MAG: CBO0543 family protein [Mycobacterium leprae]
MFYIPQAIAVWIVSIWLIDWRRLRELLIYGLWGIAVSSVEGHLGYGLGLFQYQDTGWLSGHYDVSTLVINLSAVPLFAIYFAQGLRPRAPVPWLRIAAFTAVSLVPEIVALRLGHMVYGRRWNLLHSVIAYIPTWVSIWALHRWLNNTRVSSQ